MESDPELTRLFDECCHAHSEALAQRDHGRARECRLEARELTRAMGEDERERRDGPVPEVS